VIGQLKRSHDTHGTNLSISDVQKHCISLILHITCDKENISRHILYRTAYRALGHISALGFASSRYETAGSICGPIKYAVIYPLIIYIHTHTHKYIYIYIYRERERERERIGHSINFTPSYLVVTHPSTDRGRRAHLLDRITGLGATALVATVQTFTFVCQRAYLVIAYVVNLTVCGSVITFNMAE